MYSLRSWISERDLVLFNMCRNSSIIIFLLLYAKNSLKWERSGGKNLKEIEAHGMYFE